MRNSCGTKMMESSKKLKKTTTRTQQEKLVDLMSTKIDIARNSTKRPVEEVSIFWQIVDDEFNALGPPNRDFIGWKKVWSDYKCYIKKKLAENKKEAGSTGGGPFNQKSFTPVEEAVISIINLKDTIDGIGARSFGNDDEKNISSTPSKSSQKNNPSEFNNEKISELNRENLQNPKNDAENNGYISETSEGRPTKRKPLSTTQLLNKQVNTQED